MVAALADVEPPTEIWSRRRPDGKYERMSLCPVCRARPKHLRYRMCRTCADDFVRELRRTPAPPDAPRGTGTVFCPCGRRKWSREPACSHCKSPSTVPVVCARDGTPLAHHPRCGGPPIEGRRDVDPMFSPCGALIGEHHAIKRFGPSEALCDMCDERHR